MPMWKASMLLLALVGAAAGAAQAGTYETQQLSDCPGISAGALRDEVRKVGSAAGLDLPKDMALRTELHCSADAKGRFVYTVRAAIEKQLADGEILRWAPVAQLTGFGTAAGSSAVLRQVGFTVRDVIRQEP
ncbi:MAG TPA: hypothetical protein VFM98_15910 [Ramlibacter sp.]|uniref:hypothetical protein n=1 Tax=Ramlibacter sp. TaxID=1917967 RepID=UPI002D7F8482|nr:hypothetical protein [Ramlibacter sp.]HET8747086.1 hypothetical protein [Ramlibacter sp.]